MVIHDLWITHIHIWHNVLSVVMIDHAWLIHRHLLILAIDIVHLRHMIICSQVWRGERALLVEIPLVILIHLIRLTHATAHIELHVYWWLIREHQTLAIICERRLLIITESIERQFHFSGNDQIISIFNAHLCKTFRFSRNRFFSFDVNIHFFFLNKFPQFKILNVREDHLHQDLQALVGADLDIKIFVQLMIEFGRFNRNMEA